LTDHALATRHDGDQNRRDSFRTECSDLNRSALSLNAGALSLELGKNLAGGHALDL
jgi:hypothetical protein